MLHLQASVTTAEGLAEKGKLHVCAHFVIGGGLFPWFLFIYYLIAFVFILFEDGGSKY